MKKFISGKSKKAIFSFAIVLILAAGILSQVIFPSVARADSPQFNIFTPYVHTQTFNRDYYLLDVKNETKGTDWNFPVSADQGDTLVFYLYYHNGVVNTIANNTSLRVSLPSGQNSQHTVTGYLWADNATNATQSNPLTQSVQINLSSSQTLQYISGSAKWFPNQTDWRSDAPVSFPNGQSGEQLFGSGINLGSNEGCWEFSGAIIFKAKVGSNQPPSDNYDLTVAKTVRNLTGGQSGYFESVNAQNNDRVEFKIQLNNTGNTTLNNVFVRDVLSSYDSYVSGTVRLDGFYGSDQLLSGGVNIGSLYSGGSRTITFEATITGYTSGSQTLTNYAYARADQVSERNDSAVIYISQQQSGFLTLTKYVRNLTAGQTGLLSNTNANPGDRVLFTIQVTTPSGNQVNNVRVWDSLPSGLTYVSGSGRLDGSSFSDSFFYGGINLGVLYDNQTRNITFEATVGPVALPGETYMYYGYTGKTLVNTAYASGDSMSQQQASAQVVVSSTQPQPTTFSKRVDNLTSPNGSGTDNTAQISHILKYTLSYTNSSATNLTNVQIFDTLPSYTTYQSIDSNGYYNSSINQITWSIGSLSAGNSITVSYQVEIDVVPYNNFIISNTALIKADNLGQLDSNEVRTTVGGIVKGVKVVTGNNSLPRNIATAGMISLWSIFVLYLIMEYAPAWRNLRFKLAVWKIKASNSLF
ncbi:DUF11 domain-containing protein [Patescibacteria group bacterium]|nr:DUF11 domain-containing protein [Patescibacteria group bacterium]